MRASNGGGRARVAGLMAVLAVAGVAFAAGQESAGEAGRPASAPAEDRAEWPDTPLARVARELLRVINEGDRQAAQRLIDEEFDKKAWEEMPPGALADWLMDVGKANERVDFVAVRTAPERSPDRELVVILRSAARESYLGMVLTRGGEEDRIVGLVIMPARAPRLPEADTGPITRAHPGDELDSYLQRMTAADRFSGSVLVAHDGDILFEKAYGQASRSYGAPNTTATRFSLASMGKMFTAVAIMQLVEQGRLALDDTLDRRLPPGWRQPELARRITIEQLLTHTSGLGDFMANDAFREGSRLRYRVTDDYKPLLADVALEFEPGTSWGYSNSGFLLLGAVIEAVTGRSYGEQVGEAVWGAAGMAATSLVDLDSPTPGLAEGYYREEVDGEEVLRSNSMLRSVRGSAAGGAYSTTGDLLRFDRALRSGRLLSQDSLDWMWTATEASRQRLPHGAGFIITGSDDDRRVGHGGTFRGVTTSMEMHLQTGWTVIVLCNLSGGVGGMALPPIIDDLIARVDLATPAHGDRNGL